MNNCRDYIDKECADDQVIPMARKMSLTFIAVLADVSIKRRPFSSAYPLASSNSTARLAAKSALLPARAMTILGDA